MWKVVGKVRELWKDVADGTVPQTLKLKEYLVKGQVFLGFRYMRDFIAEGCHALSKSESRNQAPDLVTLTKGTFEKTQLLMGLLESTLLIPTDKEDVALAAIATKVTEIKDVGRRFGDRLEQTAGDAGPGATLVDIRGEYAEALDTDFVKKAFSEAVRYLALNVRTREEDIYRMVLDSLNLLDEMKLIKDD